MRSGWQVARLSGLTLYGCAASLMFDSSKAWRILRPWFASSIRQRGRPPRLLLVKVNLLYRSQSWAARLQPCIRVECHFSAGPEAHGVPLIELPKELNATV